MLSDPVAEAFGLIHRHPSGENLWYGMVKEVFVMVSVAWAMQEEVFIILTPSLTEAYKTIALKIVKV